MLPGASQGSKTYGKNAHMSLGRVLAMIYTNLIGEEEAKMMYSLQMIFVALENVTIVFLGSDNSRNTHVELPI